MTSHMRHSQRRYVISDSLVYYVHCIVNSFDQSISKHKVFAQSNEMPQTNHRANWSTSWSIIGHFGLRKFRWVRLTIENSRSKAPTTIRGIAGFECFDVSIFKALPGVGQHQPTLGATNNNIDSKSTWWWSETPFSPNWDDCRNTRVQVESIFIMLVYGLCRPEVVTGHSVHLLEET